MGKNFEEEKNKTPSVFKVVRKSMQTTADLVLKGIVLSQLNNPDQVIMLVETYPFLRFVVGNGYLVPSIMLAASTGLATRIYKLAMAFYSSQTEIKEELESL